MNRISYIFLLIFLLMVSSYGHAEDCKNIDEIVSTIKFNLSESDTVNVLLDNSEEGARYLPFHEDILYKYSQKIMNDPELIHSYQINLKEHFTCEELNEIKEFSNSTYGEKFLKDYRFLIIQVVNSLNPAVKKYRENMRQEITDRNNQIKKHLSDIKSMDVPNPVEIIVAKENISSGTIIDKTKLAVRIMPAEYNISYYISAAEYEKINGKILTKDLKKGDPILLDFIE